MKTLFAVIVTLGLAGCSHHYAAHDPLACDRMVDWNDRKACKEKMETQRTEWEKNKDPRKG